MMRASPSHRQGTRFPAGRKDRVRLSRVIVKHALKVPRRRPGTERFLEKTGLSAMYVVSVRQGHEWRFVHEFAYHHS